MNNPEKIDESEAHKILGGAKRSRVLSTYFALKEKNIPALIDSDDTVLYLISIEHYESFLATSVPYDSLMKKIIDLAI